MTATIGCRVDRFFVDFTFGTGEHKQTVALQFEANTDPEQLLTDLAELIHSVSGGLVGQPALAMTVERDERDEPCPECRTGEVENLGRAERETGHQPYACNADCGYFG